MKSMKFHIKQSKTIFKTFFNIKEATVEYDHFDGSRSVDIKRFAIEKGPGAGVLIYLTDIEKYVLVEQFRYPTSLALDEYPWILETVAGTVEDGETPEEAAIKEMREESGFIPNHIRLIAEFFTTPGISSEKIYLYYATALSTDVVATGDPHDDEEDIRVHLYSQTELSQLLHDGKIRDAKTLIAVQYALCMK
jgi:ADP-ribose pyrophosphatase